MINTTLCYIEKDDDYLMLHRVKKKNDVNHDKWIGIGGKFELGESPEDCLLREAREETGLTLTRWQYRGIVTFVSDQCEEKEYMHLFTADGFEGTIKDCEEGNLEWIAKEKLFQLPIWEGDKIFLHLLEENAPFFSLKLVYNGDRLTEAVLNGHPVAEKVHYRTKEPLLISACLMGTACRYDGKSKPMDGWEKLTEKYDLIPVCPEQLGGLPTPRPPAERTQDRVLTEDGTDVTDQYRQGAEEVCRLAAATGCRKALLKQRSPSCGSKEIYDGTFSRNLVSKDGMTAELLRAAGLEIFDETQLEALL